MDEKRFQQRRSMRISMQGLISTNLTLGMLLLLMLDRA
jgi:hypothetical protein